MSRAAFLLVVLSPLFAQDRPPAPAEARAVEVVLFEGDMAQVSCEAEVPGEEVIEVILPSLAVPESVSIVDDGRPVSSFGVERDVMVSQTATTPKNGKSAEEPVVPRKRNVLRWRSTKKDPRKVTISWLAKGLGWSPRYRLAVLPDGKLRLSLSASVTNGDLPLPGVRLKFRYGPGGTPELDAASKGTRRELARLASRYWASDAPAAPVVPSYEIAPEGTHDVAPNGVSVLSLWPEADLPVEAFACWASSIAAPPAAIWRVENPRKEPLPRGRVDAWRDGAFLAGDEMPFTPPGGHAFLSIVDAGDVAVEKQLDTLEAKALDEAHRDYKWHHVFRLVARNLGRTTTTVLVLDPSYKDPLALTRDPQPAADDGRFQSWRLTLGAGQEATVRQEFWSYRAYSK